MRAQVLGCFPPSGSSALSSQPPASAPSSQGCQRHLGKEPTGRCSLGLSAFQIHQTLDALESPEHPPMALLPFPMCVPFSSSCLPAPAGPCRHTEEQGERTGKLAAGLAVKEVPAHSRLQTAPHHHSGFTRDAEQTRTTKDRVSQRNTTLHVSAEFSALRSHTKPK